MSDERGSVPILIAAIVAVLMLAMATMTVGGIAMVKARAEGAADLAALAAVTHGCDAAASIARANGARLSSCVAVDGDMRVTVAMPMPARIPLLRAGPAGLSSEVSGTARAGFG